MESTITPITRTQDFRLLIQHELLERCRKNPKYSLRAFSRSLGIGSSALSDMLNGKRTITSRMKQRLGLALGLSLEEIRSYQANSPAMEPASPSFQQLALDTFAVISDWYHYAILELMKIPGFKNDPAWIARSLGLTKNEANAAAERLIRIGLIKVGASGEWFDTSGGFSTNIIDSKLTSAAAKKLQKQILEMSIQALEQISPESRNHTSMTIAAHPRDLPDAIEQIKKFRRDLCAFLERDGNPTQVYQLGISLYPVTSFPDGGNL
jgi:hypothetical protein